MCKKVRKILVMVLSAMFFIANDKILADKSNPLALLEESNKSDSISLAIKKKGKIAKEKENIELIKLAEEKIENLTGNYYSPYVQVGGTHFFNIKNHDTTSVSLDLFFPVWQIPTDLIFSDIRVYDRPGKSFEGNFHFGYRHLLSEQQRLYGIYGSFDRKKTEFGNYFNQVMLGGECWIKNWFIGGNVYKVIGENEKPIGDASIESIEVRQSGAYKNIWVTTDGLHEKAMSGADAEVGYEITKGLVGYAGGYYFSAEGVSTVCGPRVRLTYDWSLDNGNKVFGVFDKVGFEVGVQRDKPRGMTYYLNVNIKLDWLSKRHSELQGVSRHMVDLVRRDIDIVAAGAHKREEPHTLNAEDGTTLKILEVEGAGDFLEAAADDQAHVIFVKKSIGSDTSDGQRDQLARLEVKKKKEVVFTGLRNWLREARLNVSADVPIIERGGPREDGPATRISGTENRKALGLLAGKAIKPEILEERRQENITLLPKAMRQSKGVNEEELKKNIDKVEDNYYKEKVKHIKQKEGKEGVKREVKKHQQTYDALGEKLTNTEVGQLLRVIQQEQKREQEEREATLKREQERVATEREQERVAMEREQELKLEQEQAAKQIQSLWRGYKVRQDIQQTRDREQQAAKQIQSLWRGYKVRQDIQDRKRKGQALSQKAKGLHGAK